MTWPAALEGAWETVTTVLGIEGRVVLRLEHDDAGNPVGFVDLLAIGGVGIPLENLRLGGGTIDGDVGRGHLRLHIEGWRLSGTYGRGDVEFLREHPAAAPWRIPRIDADGARVTASDGPFGALVEGVLTETYPRVDSLLLSHHGDVVLEEYFYGYGPDRLHTFQSVTKGITSVIFGILVDRGLVGDLSDPVWKYLPHRTGHKWIDERYDATVHDLLAMTVGLDWNEEVAYTDQRNDNTRMNNSGDWVGYTLDRPRRANWEPGRYEYQSGLAILLGAVIHAASGRTVDEFAAEHLFAPLGIESFRWLSEPDGTRHTGGGLYLRPRDALKIGQLVLNNGAWDGRQVVSEDWIDRSTSPQSHGSDVDHGYQWHLVKFRAGDRDVPSVTHGGYGGQYIHVLRDLDAVIVSNAHDFWGDGSVLPIVQGHLLPYLLA